MPGLIFLSGPSVGLRYQLAGETTLGRSPRCEVALDDDKVSRRHARIRVVEGEARIADLGSRNGTLVNGVRISAEAVLAPGDRLQLGDSIAEVEATLDIHAEADPQGLRTWPVDELLPIEGAEAGMYAIAAALAGAWSTAEVLRRALEQLVERIGEARAAIFLGPPDALRSAAEIGPAPLRPLGGLARAALDGKRVAAAGTALCAPLGGLRGRPIGILYADGTAFQGARERGWVAAIGRLAGEWISAGGIWNSTPVPAELVGSSRPFKRMMGQAEQAALAGDHLALIGGPGAGKRSLARHIHARSRRALGSLVEVCCTEEAPAVQRSLFGDVQASEGSAVSALIRAHRGTLLLHRIEALPTPIAQRLAGFLIRKTAPLQDGGEQPVEVRIIATGTESLEALAAKGQVASELASALPLSRLTVPPLRERSGDVLALYKAFARSTAARDGQEAPRLSQQARGLLLAYAWPGNVRELRLVAERLSMLYPGLEIPIDKLPAEIMGAGSETLGKLPERISRLEREAILGALNEARGRKLRAAAVLGISRPTLDKKIRDLGIVVSRG